MNLKGQEKQQPDAGQGVEIAGKTEKLDALLDSMDAGNQPQVTTVVDPVETPTEPEELVVETPAEPDEATETTATEATDEEDEVPEEHQSVFSPEAHKIFKERIGKKNKQIEHVKTELATVTAERDELKKTADPAMREAVTSAGIAPEFLTGDDVKVLTAASDLKRRIDWSRELVAKYPDGYEDGSGTMFSPAELMSYAMGLATDPENMACLAEARAVRKTALARQKEAIAEGLNVLKAREKTKQALKPVAKKPAPMVVPAPKASAAQIKPASQSVNWPKTGDVNEMIDAI